MSINKGWHACEIKSFSSVSKIQDHMKRKSLEYFHRHPEIRAIVRTLLHEAINKDKTEPSELAASVFDFNVNVTLKSKIDAERKFVIMEMRKSNWDKYDSEKFVSRNSSTHSLLSNTSLVNDMESILRFCLILPQKN